jgi:hypothetical protein
MERPEFGAPDRKVSEEAIMRPTVVESYTGSSRSIPRGWIILGAMTVSWAVLLALWFAGAQLFSLISASL